MAARWSAAKSQSVTSVSWPIADTTGIVAVATRRTTASVLNAHRSSSEPPPRVRMIASGRLRIRSARSSAVMICPGASSPCTDTWNQVTRRHGKRRRSTDSTSRGAAPDGDEISARCLGIAGRGCLRSSANSPSAARLALRRSKAARRAPSPAGSTCSTMAWNSPRASYTDSLARTITVMPLPNGARTNRLRFANIAQRICADRSRRLKYQCPEAGRLKFETSPSIHTRPSFSSIKSLAAPFTSDTVRIRRSVRG